MSTNCLVTKLKGVVTNNDLPKFDHLVFEYDTTDAMPYNANYASRLRVGRNVSSDTVVNDSLVLYGVDKTTVIESVSSTGIYSCTIAAPEELAKGYFDIKDKHNIRSIINMPSYWDVTLKAPIKIKVEDIKDIPNLLQLRFGGNHISGNVIDIFTSLVNYQNMTAFQLWGSPNVVGDIADFGPYTKLLTLSFKYTDGIAGTIEELVEAQVAAGRVSGTITIFEANMLNVTFHNISVTSSYNLVFSENKAEVTLNDVVKGTYANGSWTYA